MGKIFCIMGKSSSGKDTLYKRLTEECKDALFGIVPYTTRPIRAEETHGREYFFTDAEGLKELEEAGKVIESRAYQTACGEWIYFTVNDGQIDLAKRSYLVIATLESYTKIRNYFGGDFVVPIYVEVEDGLRLKRALDRERAQKEPKYAELCRRFLADAEDFSEEKLKDAGISRRFVNESLECAYREILTFIRELI